MWHIKDDRLVAISRPKLDAMIDMCAHTHASPPACTHARTHTRTQLYKGSTKCSAIVIGYSVATPLQVCIEA